jgi:HD-GYP domain-containing protein (c-di-GMP phosphodiesterase class II)
MPNVEHSNYVCVEIDERAPFPGVSSFARGREQGPVVLAPKTSRPPEPAHAAKSACAHRAWSACGVPVSPPHHLALAPGEINTSGRAARWHEIGKLAIPETILEKAARLTCQEFEAMQQHSACGAQLLLQMRFPPEVTTLVYHHYECWDGRGYPDGLQGDAIPLGARIIALANAFDAMTTNRPYQGARTAAQAKGKIWRCAGTQFDRGLADQFCTLLEDDRPAPSAFPSDSLPMLVLA